MPAKTHLVTVRDLPAADGNLPRAHKEFPWEAADCIFVSDVRAQS